MARPSSPSPRRSTVHNRSTFAPATNGHNWTSYEHQRKNGRWGIFEEQKLLGSSWLASLLPSFLSRAASMHTSRSRSFASNLHVSEGPSRRGLSSSDASAPSMLRFCLLCVLWYSTSAMSSNTGKAILNQFRYPVTLTFVQFGFVAAYCLLFTSPLIHFTKLRRPSRSILEKTLPMGIFQVGGHMFSSMAISRIPVSTVHTIKALSPLFTVAAYAMLFGVKYSPKTYISLLPLTLGVMLACSFDVSASNALGLTCAFASAIVFVSSNIFFKKVVPSNSPGAPQRSSHKLDKLNLLFYSSGMAFLLMIPMWLYYDLPALLLRNSGHIAHPAHGHTSPHGVAYYFFLNGTVHFGQNIIAFVILSSTSPVTYSIASLFKRVAVICIAILWFNQSMHLLQGLGICLTLAGLWMYNSAKSDVEKGEKKMRRVEAVRDMILPTNKVEQRMMSSPAITDNEAEAISFSFSVSPAYLAAPPSTSQARAAVQQLLPQSLHSQGNSYTRDTPNLYIKVTPPNVAQIARVSDSPTDSYPSPPLSNDSPPQSAKPMSPLPQGRSRRRGATVSYSHTRKVSHDKAVTQNIQPQSIVH